ncbi:hypothetical protein [Chengkuizengella axinellae]|uniref:Uncharacterized protein n=1 Tax=Chengkuizengella axinellae TaxID=3064388 RepID=A0ABT9ITX4_9BACL|nr:hypothetical protein [Chengkuizengella sp. 2205SS18-9]MDP5272778.1 hypothetical protein [Chengkuizengella sp. 2205SS18-9]
MHQSQKEKNMLNAANRMLQNTIHETKLDQLTEGFHSKRSTNLVEGDPKQTIRP